MDNHGQKTTLAPGWCAAWIQVTTAVRQENFFSEDLRWPSRSQRFGWLVTISIMTYIGFELNLQVTAPMIAFPAMVIMILVLLVSLTLQQHLSVRIGQESGDPVIPVRNWLRRRQRDEDERPFGQRRPTPVLRISHTIKTPVSALAPGRRGGRLARREERIPMEEVERWYASRIPRGVWFRRKPGIFAAGLERDAVTVELRDGRRLTLATRLQPVLLEALSLARVEAERQTRAPVREEL
jgi:hypothetical protein